MALVTFHLFPLLPLEIRREIYMLATPPRIVQVEEYFEEEWEDFKEEFLTAPARLTLDPSLAHFAFNWRQHVSGQIRQPRQRTLEAFGFSGAEPPQRPWEPSISTPEIPLNWLGQYPEVAWDLIRRCHLYSKAPIPPLLATCSESRAELISRGYQLAFRTRSSEPRTWFNFNRDILFLNFDSEYYGDYVTVLNASPWDVGQFHPTDMQRVRRIALQNSATYLRPNMPQNDQDRAERELSSILRLFGRLDELLLVQWTWEDIREWTEFSPCGCPGSKNRCREHAADIEAADAPQAPLSGIAVEELDAILCLFLPDSSWRRNAVLATGVRGASF